MSVWENHKRYLDGLEMSQQSTMFIRRFCAYVFVIVLIKSCYAAPSTSIVGIHPITSAPAVIPIAAAVTSSARPIVPIASAVPAAVPAAATAPATDVAKFGQTIEILGGATFLIVLSLIT